MPTEAQRFLDIVGVGKGDAEAVFEAVVEQHWVGAFHSIDQVCLVLHTHTHTHTQTPTRTHTRTHTFEAVIDHV